MSCRAQPEDAQGEGEARAQGHHIAPELPRRELIQAIGIFDEERFGRGFGEENDYCLRAARAGFRAVIARLGKDFAAADAAGPAAAQPARRRSRLAWLIVR